METQGRYILVGTVVLIAIAALFLTILYFGSGQTEYDEYKIVFTEQVSGLTVGGQVRFAGIQVGEVAKLDLNEQAKVEALVRVDPNTPVKTDTIARLEIVGFTGLAVIQFEGGSPAAEPLENTVSGIPVIQAQPSDIGLLLQGSENIVNAINKVLSPENIDNISSTLKSIETVSATVADSSEDIALILANGAQLTEDLARASDDLDRLLKDLDGLATGEAQRALANVETVAANARDLVENLNAIVDENRESLRSFTNNGLQQVGPAVTEARRLIRTMDNFLKQLERDPRGYLLGEAVPEYEAGR